MPDTTAIVDTTSTVPYPSLEFWTRVVWVGAKTKVVSFDVREELERVRRQRICRMLREL